MHFLSQLEVRRLEVERHLERGTLAENLVQLRQDRLPVLSPCASLLQPTPVSVGGDLEAQSHQSGQQTEDRQGRAPDRGREVQETIDDRSQAEMKHSPKNGPTTMPRPRAISTSIDSERRLRVVLWAGSVCGSSVQAPHGITPVAVAST